MKNKKKVLIVGGGPGGLAASMLLAHRGFSVELFEKNSVVGGRNAHIDLDGFKFDIGPTFLMMKFLLDNLFEQVGLDINDYMKFIKLDPMYKLQFADKQILMSSNREKTKAEIERVFPGLSKGYDKFMSKEEARFKRLLPCLQKDYPTLISLMSKRNIKALPYLSLGQSVFDVLKSYFQNDDLSLLFSFQSKYLGMSAWDCPGGFSMLSYIEHAYGVYHVMGGLSEISASMAKAAQSLGANFHLNTPVKQLIVKGKKVIGVETEDEKIFADEVIVNADFAYAMDKLVPKNTLKKYTPKKLEKMKYSCSTFMLYLCLDKIFPSEHHTIVFAKNYKKNVDDVFKNETLSDDFSFYVRNASVNDPSLAPKNQSSLYVLVPVPNCDAQVDWETTQHHYRNLVLDMIEERMQFKNLRQHIINERIFTPNTWEQDLNVYKGATFNLSHNLGQLAYFRPRNKFEEFDQCYIVGGGTHPGSGLPTILQSSIIASNLISKKHNINYICEELTA
ncbi:MAG TPA: phytoene desaturase family protein [Oligoflexia bacterium]|nr:phytoene desaturase family protein [Oligoflexia bacterium]HMR24874.1 phytoene desaturase family protein [Oligoflexia bacterium]